MDSFNSFAPDLLQFLRELKSNNSKDWFTANKATYETFLKEPGKLFAADMSLALSELTGQKHNSKCDQAF